MQQALSAVRILALASLLLLSACSGGGGGGGGGTSNVFALNGGVVSGTVSYASQVPSQIYTFNAVADTAYNISAVTTAGNVYLTVYNGSPASGTLLGYSWNSLSTTPYNAVNFIAGFTGPVYIVVVDATGTLNGSTTYYLQATTGDLAIGTTKTASTYNSSINYSFEAVSGTAYQVRLTPQSGNVNIGSVNAKLTTSVGSSSLLGTATDTVTFLAPASQRYYVKVSPASVGTTFDIQVNTTTSDPDLSVVVDSAVSDGNNITVNYTVHNQGINAAGAFGVTGWSDAASTPTVGSTGQASSPSYASLVGGASLTGTLIIPNTAISGTAFVIVDTASAVAEANESNNVSAGKAWQKPLIAPQSFAFTSGPIPSSMTLSGNAAWAIDSTTGSGAPSLKAGTIGNSQTSCTAMSVAQGVSISFDYAVSSEGSYDYLRFYIDGVQSRSWSGTVLWTSSGAIPVSSGTHEYKWCYTKDGTTLAGSDTAWIDNIVVTAAPPPTVDLQVAINSAISNGSSVTVNYTVNNAGNSASGPFNVDIFSHNASVPSLGAIGQSTLPTASLAAGGSVTGSVTIANATTAGTAYAIVDTTNAVIETNDSNNVSLGKPWTVSIDLQVVINSAVSDRNNVVVNYTVSNPAANPAGPFNVDLWSDSASAPVVGSTGPSIVAIPSLAAGATVTKSVSIPNTGAGGTAYAIVDTTNAVAEGIETNNVSPGAAWIAPLLAPLSYNFNNSVVPAEMLMSGNTAWSANTSGKGANIIYTLKAGTIIDNQTSCVAVSAANSYSVSFDYSVDSESCCDSLTFSIDGVQKNSWSGAVAWTPSGVITATTPGLHEYKWCYKKDGSVATGSDTAWIDNVVIN